MEELLNSHVKEYKIKCLACLAEMQKVWQDLEVSESAGQIEVSNAIAEACGAWSNALTRCAHQRAEVAAQISALLDQAGMIAEELGEGTSTGNKVNRQRKEQCLRIKARLRRVGVPRLVARAARSNKRRAGGKEAWSRDGAG